MRFGTAIVFAGCVLVACGGDSGGGVAVPDNGGGEEVAVGCTENDQKACTTGEGWEGTQDCKDGAWTECKAACDDGEQAECTLACGSKGKKVCVEGKWGTCNAPAETCNGEDDDCDGTADEDLARDCETACGKGTETCKAGAWEGCTAAAPGTEVCNGKDDDCDGATDESLTCACSPNQTQVCGKDEGECYPGTQSCVDGKWGPCGGASFVDEKTEVCNDKDDDCDGKTDEDLTRDCETTCGKGKETCTDGKWEGCTAKVPSAETCNGEDDDCNGKVDDGLSGDAKETNQTCQDYRDLGNVVVDTPSVFAAYTIYPAGDEDWFRVTFKDVGSIIPCLPSFDDGCYIGVVQLSGVPDGVEYELNVLVDDCDATGGSFAGETFEGPDLVSGFGWKGEVVFSDDRTVYVQVKPKAATMGSCVPYTLTFDLYNDCPDGNGLCSWEQPVE
ncbi:MAG: hypothetical protein FJ087_13200 [Deltaproteobacteria bacterium]|nr:hypothetical protein [Deltaproteobacteria bacterium]